MSGAILQVTIRGRVQGVGYRAFVEHEARQRQISGWVRNRRDGGVEAVIAGSAEAIDALIARCHAGPSGARVDMVRVLDEPDQVDPGFTVRPTV